MRGLVVAAPLMVLLCLSSVRADEGLLGQVREQVDAPAQSCPEGKRDRHKGGDCDAADHILGDLFGDFFADGLGPAVGETLLAPFLLPPRALGDDYQTYGYLPRFPYAYGLPGDLWLDRAAEGDPRPRGLRDWEARLSVEDGYDFRGVNRVGTRLFLDTAIRLGVSTDWDFFTERLRCGCYDELTLGDANLTFRFAQSEWMQMYAGVGGRVMPDRYGTRGGFNFTYGGDMFPCKPVVLSSSLDLGNLGSAGLVRVRGEVGLVHRHWELFGGYDFLRIGSVDLQGPMAGLRLWF